MGPQTHMHAHAHTHTHPVFLYFCTHAVQKYATNTHVGTVLKAGANINTRIYRHFNGCIILDRKASVTLVWSVWVGICNRKQQHSFWHWTFTKQSDVHEYVSATGNVDTDSEMGCLQDSFIYVSRCLQQGMFILILRWEFTRQFTLYKYTGICNWVRLHWFRDGTFTRQLDLYEASATWNVYTDSKMGCLQDSLICLSSMRGNCNQKCLHRFWDRMFTRQFWAVWKASAKGNVYLDSEMGRLQDSLICISVWEASAPGNEYIDSKMGCLQDSLICTRGICNLNRLNHWVVWCLHDKAFFKSKFYLYE